MRHPFLSQLRGLLVFASAGVLFGGFLAALWLAYQSTQAVLAFAGFGGPPGAAALIQGRLATFGSVFAVVVGVFLVALFFADLIRWMLNVEDHLYHLRPDVQRADASGAMAIDGVPVDAFAPPAPRWYERAGDWLAGLAGVPHPEVTLEPPNLPPTAALPSAYANGTGAAEGHATTHDATEPEATRPPEAPEPPASSAPPFVDTDSVPIVSELFTNGTHDDRFAAAGMDAPPAPVDLTPIADTDDDDPPLSPLEPEPEPAMRPLSKLQRLGVTGELRKPPKTGRLGGNNGEENGPANKQKQAELHFQRALKYFKRAQYVKAGQHFYQATRLNPNHERARQGYERCRELVQNGETG